MLHAVVDIVTIWPWQLVQVPHCGSRCGEFHVPSTFERDPRRLAPVATADDVLGQLEKSVLTLPAHDRIKVWHRLEQNLRLERGVVPANSEMRRHAVAS